MSGFIKEFFAITFFYTVMINAGPWLSSITHTAVMMGTALVQQKVDPVSIIMQGFAIANALMAAANNTSFLVNIFSIIIVSFSYIIILIIFFAVALDLAVTIIANSILISIASMSLAFAAFPFTRSVARKTLDLVISNSIKLLILYIVIAAGSELLIKIAKIIPTDNITTFDTFGWVVVSCLLFGMVAKYIPQNIVKIFTSMIQEMRSGNSSSLVLSDSILAAKGSAVDATSANMAKIRTAEINISSAKFNHNHANLNNKYDSLAGHFKDIASKRK
jgi:P-type conjugative transfer protein TrbL